MGRKPGSQEEDPGSRQAGHSKLNKLIREDFAIQQVMRRGTALGHQEDRGGLSEPKSSDRINALRTMSLARGR
jgi:hypothetical protein